MWEIRFYLDKETALKIAYIAEKMGICVGDVLRIAVENFIIERYKEEKFDKILKTSEEENEK
ncbi:MAG: hypothetical protein QXN68_06375 [Thermoplasmata archaeon]